MKPALMLVTLSWLVACSADDSSPSSNGGAGSGGLGGSGLGGANGDASWPDTGAGGASGTSAGGSGGGSTGGSGGTAPGGDCTTLAAWKQSAAFADGAHVSHPLPSFGVNSRYYVHTMASAGGERVLYSGKQNADGSLGAWEVASPDHGGGPHGYTALVVNGEPFHFRNGHIARYPLDANGKMTGDVVLLESNPDSAFGGNRYVWDSALVATFASGSFVIHLGGFSFTGYTYKPNLYRNKLPIQPAFTAVGADHPAQRPGKCAFWATPGASTGWIFSGDGNGSKYWRTKALESGSVEAWSDLGTLPSGTDNQRGDWFVVDGTLFVVRGAKVFGAKIDAQGVLGSFKEQPALPEPQIDVGWGEGHLEGRAHAVLGDYVYLTGKKSVFYTKVLKKQACSP